MKALATLTHARHVRPKLERRKGLPLPAEVRQLAEELFGEDFAEVRVHVTPVALRLGALAFTSGSDIYFAPGRYTPDSARGLQLLGHELAHVVQQRRGHARNPHGYGLAVVRDSHLEEQAERMGHALQMKAMGQHEAATSPRARQAVIQGMEGAEEQVIHDNAGHGGMTLLQIDGKTCRKKSTNLVEAYVYARLAVDERPLARFMPQLLRIYVREGMEERVYPPDTFGDFIADYGALKEVMGKRECKIAITDLKSQLESSGYELLDVLDVKIGQHTFSNREAKFRGGVKAGKSIFNKLQMTFGEKIADAGFLIATGSNKLTRQFNYKDSKKNLKLFVTGLTSDAREMLLKRLSWIEEAVAKSKLALIGSSILLMKVSKDSQVSVLPYVIDPAHGFFEDEILGSEASLRAKYGQSYDNFFEFYLNSYMQGLGSVIEVIASVKPPEQSIEMNEMNGL